MTAKQDYDERKRLRNVRLLREEQRQFTAQEKQDDMEAQMVALMGSFERIASVMELWADMQGEKT